MEKNIKSFQEIQGFLSVGYIYLIVMGIIYETLFYNQIGINILNYSTILDVLISPISKLTESFYILGVFVIIILLAFNLPRFFSKNKNKTWVIKLTKLDKDLTKSQIEDALLKTYLYMISFGLFGFYIGNGLKKGETLSEKIENHTIDYNDQIKFINGETLTVDIVGTNSTYIFYLEKDNQNVQITPISGVVKSFHKSK